MDELVKSNANVAFGVSRLLNESTEQDAEFEDCTEGHDSEVGEEEDDKMPNVSCVIPPIKDPKLTSRGLKKKEITKTKAKMYYSHRYLNSKERITSCILR